jgi:DNA primase
LIPEQFISDLSARADIVDVINQIYPLKKAGENYKSVCPFHKEKTASFTVSPVKQIYHCFGCGAGGDAIKFIQEYKGLGFVEAVEELASRYGMTVPTHAAQDPLKLEEQQSIYKLLADAAEFYIANLKQHTTKAKAVNYLQNRKITGIIAKKFMLGFASNNWSELLEYFRGKYSHITEQELLTAGLISKNQNNKIYDKFRDRVIFPIRDYRGRVVGFGGRVIDQGEPKYLNSPDTPVFSKGKLLYGLYEALQENRHFSSLVFVEGYMDVIALNRVGITNSVATLGTAVTEQHIKIAFKYVDEIIYCYDGDSAGQKAAWKALELTMPLLEDGKKAKFLILTGGEDPDSLVAKSGKTGFLLQIEAAYALADYFFNTLQADYNLKQLEERAAFANKARKLLSLLPKSIFKDMMYDRLANITGLYYKSKFQKKIDSAGNRLGKWNNIVVNYGKNKWPDSPVKKAIVAIIMHDNLLNSIDVNLLNNLQIGVSLEIDLFKLVAEKLPEMRAKQLSKKNMALELPEYLQQKFLELEFDEPVASIPESGLQEELIGAISWMLQQTNEKEISTLLQKAKVEKLSNEEMQQLQHMLVQKEVKLVD